MYFLFGENPILHKIRILTAFVPTPGSRRNRRMSTSGGLIISSLSLAIALQILAMSEFLLLTQSKEADFGCGRQTCEKGGREGDGDGAGDEEEMDCIHISSSSWRE